LLSEEVDDNARGKDTHEPCGISQAAEHAVLRTELGAVLNRLRHHPGHEGRHGDETKGVALAPIGVGLVNRAEKL